MNHSLAPAEMEYMALTAPEPCSGAEVLMAFRDGYNDLARKMGIPTTDTHGQDDAMCQAAGAFAVAWLVAGTALAEATRPSTETETNR